MTHDSHGLHHYHKRKRIHKNLEPYPHPHKWKRFMDSSIYLIGVFGPMMTIPQLVNIWVFKKAEGVSALSWAAYLVAAIFWLIYGIMHKEKPIIMTYALWIILDLAIVIGAIVY